MWTVYFGHFHSLINFFFYLIPLLLQSVQRHLVTFVSIAVINHGIIFWGNTNFMHKVFIKKKGIENYARN